MSEIVMPGALDTMGDKPNEALVSDAMGRISHHEPARLNAVAHAVTDVLGFTTFSRRYAIAVLALEALDRTQQEGTE